MLNYLKYLPRNFSEDISKHWPLIIFLHGVGERGSDVNIVKRNGLPKTIEAGMNLQFIVIAPQCPHGNTWQTNELNKVLDDVLEKYPIDISQIYLTGLSMGGFGTWKFAMEYPKFFAAIAPVCGGSTTFNAHKVKKIPTWIFHGKKDKVIPVEKSIEMYNELKKLKANVKITIYPEAEHDSWTETYNNPELYEWFLKHSL